MAARRSRRAVFLFGPDRAAHLASGLDPSTRPIGALQVDFFAPAWGFRKGRAEKTTSMAPSIPQPCPVFQTLGEVVETLTPDSPWPRDQPVGRTLGRYRESENLCAEASPYDPGYNPDHA